SRERLGKLVDSCEASFKTALEALPLKNVEVSHSDFQAAPGGVQTVVNATGQSDALDFRMTVPLSWANGDGINVGLGNVGFLSGMVTVRNDKSRSKQFGYQFANPVAVNPVTGVDSATLKMKIDEAIRKL
ncbi:MAG: hypothetical protein WA431_16500, partial [Candidatus Cybelea sp.]